MARNVAGMIGSAIATEATSKGHSVTPVSRSGEHGVVAATATDTQRIAELATAFDQHLSQPMLMFDIAMKSSHFFLG